MENNVAIRFEHVNKSYGDREILKDFNLEIRKGEFLTIIGSSGSGKTTVLKLINGIDLSHFRDHLCRWERYFEGEPNTFTS